jgi:hypothetical protein
MRRRRRRSVRVRDCRDPGDTIFLLCWVVALAVMIWLGSGAAAHAADSGDAKLGLAWTPVADARLVGYRVCSGPAGGARECREVPAEQTSVVLGGLACSATRVEVWSLGRGGITSVQPRVRREWPRRSDGWCCRPWWRRIVTAGC